MKKILPIIFSILAALCCQKIPDPLDMSYEITVDEDKMTFDSVWLEVIPSNNDFFYWVGVESASELAAYKNDEAFITAKMEELRLDYEKRGYGAITFFDLETEKGAYWGRQVFLEPDTDYYALAFTIDDGGNAVMQLHKIAFRTKPKSVSDITFDVSLDGTVFTVTPSNDDSYYYDYATEEEIDEDYAGSPTAFFVITRTLYEEYGFASAQCETGISKSDAADYYTLEAGDKLYLVASGYKYGVTSEIYIWEIEYGGEGNPGIVKEYHEFDF